MLAIAGYLLFFPALSALAHVLSLLGWDEHVFLVIWVHLYFFFYPLTLLASLAIAALGAILGRKLAQAFER